MSSQKDIKKETEEYFKKPLDELVEGTTTEDIKLDNETFYIIEFKTDPFNQSEIKGRRHIVTFFKEEINADNTYLSINVRYKQEPPFNETDIQSQNNVTARMKKDNISYIYKLKPEPESLLKIRLRMLGGKIYRKKSMRKTYKKTQKKNKSRKYRK